MKKSPAQLAAIGIFFAFIVAMVFLFIGLRNDPHVEVGGKNVGQPLAPFALPDLFDENILITNDDIQGPALINIWATWCVACKIEHPYLVQLKQRGIRIYGLDYGDKREKALAELAKAGNPYERVIFDAKGSLVLELGGTAAPETYFINGEGRVLHRRIGELNERVWQAEFAKYFELDEK